MTPPRLRQHRLDLGYSIYLMAEILQVHPERLEAWEKGSEPIPDPEGLNGALEALANRDRNQACDFVILDGIRG
jgi:transcriptional regulator with XRE-family HTH domain